MNNSDFKKLLLSSAFHAMACDGEVHEEEIRSIHSLSEDSSYFAELDLDLELKRLSDELKVSTRNSFRKYFGELRESHIETLEQFQLIEVVLRIVYADQRVDDNEILFLRKIISTMGVLPEMLQQRFGSINSLLKIESLSDLNIPKRDIDMFEAPEISMLKGIDMISSTNDGKKGN